MLLSGEAGIGKSRLTAVLSGAAGGRAAYALAIFLFAAAHGQRALSDHCPYGAGRRARARGRCERPSSTSSMRCSLKPATSREDAALLAEMLSLPNDGRYPALELAPQQRRQKTMEALIRQIELISRQTPMLMIFEDAHWADPSSLEVFGLIVDKIEALAGAAVRDFPAGIRRALDRATARGGAHPQSVGAARRDAMIDRVAGRSCCQSTSGRTSSSAPTAFPCSWRK